MKEIFSNTDSLIAIISVLLSVIIGFVLALLYRFLKKTRYNEKSRKIELESIRNSLEKEMYRLNERLMSNEERWKDVNHLFLRKELLSPVSNTDLNRKIQINNFLKSNGVTEEDLEIDKKLIFVLNPFNNLYNDDYLVIKNTCAKVGLRCLRGDETYFSSDIFSLILKNIVKSNLVIANINGRNPNVLYELGIAQALDKPTILIAKSLQDLPIDIKSKRFLIYKDNKELEFLLQQELIKVFSTI